MPEARPAPRRTAKTAARKPGLAPLSGQSEGHKKRSQFVYECLKDDMSRLVIPPGVRLYETDVSARYGASRTPVREALNRLVREGLIHKVGRSYVVRSYTVQDVMHIYQIREALDCLAGRLVTGTISESELSQLKDLLDQMTETAGTSNVDNYLCLDRTFHLLIARFTKNAFLEQEMTLLYDKIAMIQAQWRSRLARFPLMHVAHERLYDAIRRRDAAIVEAEMRYHCLEFMTSMRTASERLDQEQDVRV
jgi:DNA-binding GntR family transcriptional regulator